MVKNPVKSANQEDGYLTKTGYFLAEEGALTKNGSHIISITSEFQASEIPAIDQFFTILRSFWREMYYKPIFRPKLKKKVDFREFISKK